MKSLVAAVLSLASFGCFAETLTVDVELVKTQNGSSVVEHAFTSNVPVRPAAEADIDLFAGHVVAALDGLTPTVMQFGEPMSITSGCTINSHGSTELAKTTVMSGTTVILHVVRNAVGLVVLNVGIDRNVVDHIRREKVKGCIIELPTQHNRRGNGRVPVLAGDVRRGSARKRVIGLDDIEVWVTVRAASAH